jgi:hypothetical protein
MKREDFEKLADSMSGKWNSGKSISRCDRVEIDDEKKTIDFVEETRYFDPKKDFDKEFSECVRKMTGSILVLGMVSHENDEWKRRLGYSRNFYFEALTDDELRGSKEAQYFKEKLKELKNGIFDIVDVKYLN